MKRGLALLFVLLCALHAAVAEEGRTAWESACEWATARDTHLYTASYAGDGANVAYTFHQARALPAGTPVMVLDAWQDMLQIACWLDSERVAWIPAADVCHRDPEAAAIKAALVNEGYPGHWGDLPMTLHRGDTEIPVRLVTLGSAQSLVYDGQEVFPAPTYDLYWETAAEPTQQLAVIAAPRTGKATLRISPASDGRELMQCSSGTLVIVLIPGEAWTHILCDGQSGYILTSALTFLSASTMDGILPRELHYKGKTDPSATISMYLTPSFERKVAEFPAGTQVLLFKEGRTWSLVEVNGMRGYVKTAYLR